MQNRLTKSLNRLHRFPKMMRPFLVDQIIGTTVKFVGTAGIHFETLSQQEVKASIGNRRKVRNHIGQVHAAAMMLLAETATGIVVGMNIPDDKIPLIKELNTRFVRRSEGKITATATLTDAQIEQLHQTEKGDFVVPVKVVDATGAEVIEVEAVWAWIPKRKK